MPTKSDKQAVLIDEIDFVVEKVVRRTRFSKAVIAPRPSIHEAELWVFKGAQRTGVSKERSLPQVLPSSIQGRLLVLPGLGVDGFSLHAGYIRALSLVRETARPERMLD